MLDDLEPARHFAQCVREDFAVLANEDLGHVVPPLVEQLADAEEELRPLGQRGAAPGGEGFARGLDGGVNLLDAREVDGPGLAAGRRVVDRAAAAGTALHPASPDPVRDPGRSGRVDGLGHGE